MIKNLCTSVKPESLIPDFNIGDYTVTVTQKIVAQYEDFVTKEIIKAIQSVANKEKIEVLVIDKSVIIEMITLYNEKHKGEETDDLFKR